LVRGGTSLQPLLAKEGFGAVILPRSEEFFCLPFVPVLHSIAPSVGESEGGGRKDSSPPATCGDRLRGCD
jgi:hypothetical protein